MQFDRNKLRAVILHTCRACPPDRLGATKLHKVLYFLDMIAFAQNGNAVTASTYRKRPFGPTCVQLLPMLRDLQREGSLEVKDTDYFGLLKKEYIALVPEEPGVLNDAELALLDEVVDFVCNQNSARTISEYSHKLPWEMAEFGAEIPYQSALLLFPSEVSPEAMERVEQGVDEIEAARSSADPLGFTELSAFRSRVLAEIGQGGVPIRP